MTDFAARLIAWQGTHGRHDLPWQGADAYRVWLSEIMLQQTQVVTVIPYFERFVASFPDIAALAVATEEQVLAHWSGLGYYARGRNLHKTARIIAAKHRGEFPREFAQILDLPGIGRSTAAAICALAYHERRAILDGNVRRVLARHCGIEGWAGEKRVEEQLWQRAEALLPQRDVAVYTQALMDMGATVCTRSKPQCAACPVRADCIALHTHRLAVLPTPRPRKAVPEKYSTFLLLMHGNDILLEKRPASGIWGGLWCPPQFDDEQAAMAAVQSDGYHCARPDPSGRLIPRDISPFTHTFTHFKLHITPLLIRVAGKPQRAQQAGGMWLSVEDALQAAIPAPVRRLLRKLEFDSGY